MGLVFSDWTYSGNFQEVCGGELFMNVEHAPKEPDGQNDGLKRVGLILYIQSSFYCVCRTKHKLNVIQGAALSRQAEFVLDADLREGFDVFGFRCI